jgi:hypothetical protein
MNQQKRRESKMPIKNAFHIRSDGTVKRITPDEYLKTIYNTKRPGRIVGFIDETTVLFHKDGQSIFFATKQLRDVANIIPQKALIVPEESESKKL